MAGVQTTVHADTMLYDVGLVLSTPHPLLIIVAPVEVCELRGPVQWMFYADNSLPTCWDRSNGTTSVSGFA
jgi:hypothetical protein